MADLRTCQPAERGRVDFSGPLTSGAEMDWELLEEQGAVEQANKASNDQVSGNTKDYCLPVRGLQRKSNGPI